MEGIPEEDRIAHERTKTGKFDFRLFSVSACSQLKQNCACTFTYTVLASWSVFTYMYVLQVHVYLYSLHACSHKVSTNCCSLYAINFHKVLDLGLKVGPCNVSPNCFKINNGAHPECWGASNDVCCAETRLRWWMNEKVIRSGLWKVSTACLKCTHATLLLRSECRNKNRVLIGCVRTSLACLPLLHWKSVRGSVNLCTSGTYFRNVCGHHQSNSLRSGGLECVHSVVHVTMPCTGCTWHNSHPCCVVLWAL